MDKIDMHILSHLMNNCRESDRKIGKNIGISGNAVNSRIKKLEQLKIIEGYTIKIEPPILGYGIFYVVVSGDDIDEKLNQVKLIGEPFFTVPCVGGITVCGIVVKEEVEKKIELAKNIMKDVRVLSIFEAEGNNLDSNLTKTDLEIIDKLLDNPRKKIEDVAKEAKLSTKTITRSLEKLYANESIQFTTIYDPSKLENYIPYAVLTWINGNMGKIKKILDKKYGKNYMQIPFLTKNQIVLFLYSNNIFKMDEVTQDIRKIPGVDFTDIFIPKKISFPYMWIKNAITNAKKSPTLHLTYHTN